MPRFIYCRLNDIFSLIMTFHMGYEFLYQINKNVSTFKYHLQGVWIILVYFSNIKVVFFSFCGSPKFYLCCTKFNAKSFFPFFCCSCYILIGKFLGIFKAQKSGIFFLTFTINSTINLMNGSHHHERERILLILI